MKQSGFGSVFCLKCEIWAKHCDSSVLGENIKQQKAEFSFRWHRLAEVGSKHFPWSYQRKCWQCSYACANTKLLCCQCILFISAIESNSLFILPVISVLLVRLFSGHVPSHLSCFLGSADLWSGVWVPACCAVAACRVWPVPSHSGWRPADSWQHHCQRWVRLKSSSVALMMCIQVKKKRV